MNSPESDGILFKSLCVVVAVAFIAFVIYGLLTDCVNTVGIYARCAMG